MDHRHDDHHASDIHAVIILVLVIIAYARSCGAREPRGFMDQARISGAVSSIRCRVQPCRRRCSESVRRAWAWPLRPELM